jgi:hypothetical protein
MQIEEIQKLKISCLELATKISTHEPSLSLDLAKSFFEWVNTENSDFDSKTKIQNQHVPE